MADYISGVGITFEVDADLLLAVPTETPDFQALNITELSQSLNEALDTWFNLGDEGFATNKVTALDPQFDLTFKFASDDTLGLAIYKKRLSTDRALSCQLTDPATSEVISFTGEMVAISDSRTVDAVIEVTLSIKLQGKPTIA